MSEALCVKLNITSESQTGIEPVAGYTQTVCVAQIVRASESLAIRMLQVGFPSDYLSLICPFQWYLLCASGQFLKEIQYWYFPLFIYTGSWSKGLWPCDMSNM